MLKHLFEPIQIKGHRINNRISMPAMHLHYVEDGYVSEQLLAFYRSRSQGGVGMIIVGGCSIDELGGGPGFIGLSDDKYLPGLSKLTDTLHSGGAKAFAQLYHAGKYAPSHHIDGRQAVSASAKRSKLTGEMPKALDKQGIQQIQQSFAQAASRAQKAGFDGVEIISSAGYLICQFLSQTTNSRSDEYGGSLENRMRFGLEVIDAVRQATDDSFVLGARLSGNDFVKGGNTNQEWQQIAQAFAQKGVDFFNVTGGWHETKVPQITMGVPHGAFVYLAAGIKSTVDVPVITSNRINDPRLADEFIRQGLTDMVNMGRPLIADPDLPNKAKNGDLDLVQQCLACNQGCFDSIFSEKPVQCVVNPLVSREHELQLSPAQQSKKVVVIGGGVAGMKTALVADQRGHDVTLFEKRKLGGQMDIVSASPDREEFATLEKNLVAQLHRSRVQLEMQKFNPQNLQQYDTAILASGGKEIKPNIPGIDQANVHSAWSVLRQEPAIGQNIVIIGGGAVGCETALALAHMGTLDAPTTRFLVETDAEELETIKKLIIHGPKNITILEMLDKIGKDIGITTRWTIIQDLKRHKVKMQTQAKVTEIASNSVKYNQNGEDKEIKADTIIYAVGTRAENELTEPLAQNLSEYYVIGDAKQPRKAMDAIHEGFFTAAKV